MQSVILIQFMFKESFLNEGDSRCTGYLSYCVVPRSTDRGKALQPSHHHIVRSAGAVDDQQLSIGIPSADNTHMGIIWIEHQVTGLCV